MGLLCGKGAAARGWASRLAAVCRPSSARSCFEVGAPLQLTVDAPGPASLRVGLRVDDQLEDAGLVPLVEPDLLARFREAVRAVPRGEHDSLGTWLFCSESERSIYLDLRDPTRGEALRRLAPLLDEESRLQLRRLQAHLAEARPWALRLDAGGTNVDAATTTGGLPSAAGGVRCEVLWLLERTASAKALAELVAPGRWSAAMRVLAPLVPRPERAGRFVLTTPLDPAATPRLEVTTTGWSLVPEADAKHRAVGQAVAALGGSRSHAEALWSLCRGIAGPRWRVGRAAQARIGEGGPGLRLYFNPDVSG